MPAAQGASRHNSSLNHYGGPFGNESRQTALPSCMNKVHGYYMWSSQNVPGSVVCNRPGACCVHNRVSSNIAKVDRSGQVVSCGPTPMEAAVMSRGGRIPETVAAAVSTAQTLSDAARNDNVISSRYIDAAAAADGNNQTPAAAGYAPSVSSVY